MKAIGLSNVFDTFERLEASVDDDGVVYFVGTNVEYAVYQELGTSKMQPQPYIRPAVNSFNRLGAEKYIANYQPGALGGLTDTEDLVKASALALEKDIAERAPVDTGALQASVKTVKG